MAEKKYNKIDYNNEFNKNNYDWLSIVTPKGNKDIIQDYCKTYNKEHEKEKDFVKISINNIVNMLLRDYFKDKGIELK